MSRTAHHRAELRALADRVTAQSAIELPTVGCGLTWRPATTTVRRGFKSRWEIQSSAVIGGGQDRIDAAEPQ
ncbi:hypothetical protein [Streptomyces sp. NPDC056154]